MRLGSETTRRWTMACLRRALRSTYANAFIAASEASPALTTHAFVSAASLDLLRMAGGVNSLPRVFANPANARSFARKCADNLKHRPRKNVKYARCIRCRESTIGGCPGCPLINEKPIGLCPKKCFNAYHANLANMLTR